MTWIRRIIEEMDKEFAYFDTHIDQLFNTTDGNSKIYRIHGPSVNGFSISIGPDDRPVVKEYRDEKTFLHDVEPSNARDPYVDVINDEKEGVLKITAELPGLKRDEIKADVTEDSLSLSADAGDKRYRKEIKLPVPVDVKSSKASYVNGVLELKLRIKQTKPDAKGFRVKVE